MPTPLIEEINNRKIPPHILFNNIEQYPYSFLLDSAISYEAFGRYSILGCEPFLVFKSKGDSITLEWNDGRYERLKANPFLMLKGLFKRFTVQNIDSSLPFICGGVGYFAYDMKDFIERLPDIAADDMQVPDCVIGFYDTALVYDNSNNKIYLSSVEFPGIKTSPAKDKILKSIFSRNFKKRKGLSLTSPIDLRSNFSKAGYIDTINRAKEYIRSGDIYQVNLSQRFEAEFNTNAYDLFLRLRSSSPAPFASYLNFKDCIVASSSPERFLMKKGAYIETRPIKGTRPRSKDAFIDSINKKELLASQKDRAEHVMIVDLERNDLGRICEYGSVRPAEFITLEKYSTVFHLVSTVSGKLKKDIDAIDCLLAAFPGGSITGAPKIRSMEIIEELEPVKRSIYTGAIGYISFDGNMDTSIVIRTVLVKGKKAYFQVGGGIVADSDPGSEYEETLDKAEGFMLAIGVKSKEEVLAG